MNAAGFDAAKFLRAQKRQYADALGEISSGRKTSHWIWFVFPQLAALGRSDTAVYYGPADLAEAKAIWPTTRSERGCSRSPRRCLRKTAKSSASWARPTT